MVYFETFEMFLNFILFLFVMAKDNIRYTAGTIPIYKNKMVMVSATSGNIIFPKGKIEKGETKEETAKRETMEESGYVGKITGKTYEIEHVKKEYVEKITLFKMKVTEILDNFKEKDKRHIFHFTKEEFMSNKKIPAYLKEIFKNVDLNV